MVKFCLLSHEGVCLSVTATVHNLTFTICYWVFAELSPVSVHCGTFRISIRGPSPPAVHTVQCQVRQQQHRGNPQTPDVGLHSQHHHSRDKMSLTKLKHIFSMSTINLKLIKQEIGCWQKLKQETRPDQTPDMSTWNKLPPARSDHIWNILSNWAKIVPDLSLSLHLNWFKWG